MSDERIPIANPHDYGFNRDPMPLYEFQFGAYATVRVYAWGCHTLEDALEAAAEWLKDNHPGVFSDEPEYAASAEELGAPDGWEDADTWSNKVREHAEADMTYTESGWLLSYEWTLSEVHDPDVVSEVRRRSIGASVDKGTVSHGTLLAGDLVHAFYLLLESLDSTLSRKLHDEYTDILTGVGYGMLNDEADPERADDLLAALSDALDNYAPEGHHFGAHPGDGSDFGFWPNEDDA